MIGCWLYPLEFVEVNKMKIGVVFLKRLFSMSFILIKLNGWMVRQYQLYNGLQ